MQERQFGYFDDAHREYVITNPQTPWPWINYLGNEDFFSLISNTAGGYSFYKDAKFRRITRYRYNRWIMEAVTSISAKVIRYGIPGGNLVRRHLIFMSAVTV